jgi:hypothetical protein
VIKRQRRKESVKVNKGILFQRITHNPMPFLVVKGSKESFCARVVHEMKSIDLASDWMNVKGERTGHNLHFPVPEPHQPYRQRHALSKGKS